MGHKSSWGADNRGFHAVSEVIVYRDGSSEVHGILATGDTAPGLKWEEVGLEKLIGNAEMPTTKIDNEALATALKKKALASTKSQSGTVELRQEELDTFNVSVTFDSYILVDDKTYYRPAATKIAYKLGAGVGGDKFMGRQLSDGSWVKARTVGPEPEYLLALGEGFNLPITRKKVWELEALTDAHFMMQSYHDKDLDEVGIDSVFHGILISAGLDLETLKMVADDRRYLACELEKAGITKPGDRVKIIKKLMARKL